MAKATEDGATDGAWRHLLRAADLFRAIVARDAPKEKLGRLTINQARICAHVFRCRAEGRPVGIKTLARELDVTPAATSQAVERLVAYGVLRRHADPEDRRAVRLSFSAVGDSILRHHERLAAEAMESVAAVCGPEDFAAFARVIGHLAEELDRRWAASLGEQAADRTVGATARFGHGKQPDKPITGETSDEK